MYGLYKDLGLAGKSIIVTGGASGIGRSTTLLLASVGANVTIGDVNEDGMAETIAMGKDLPGDITALRTDVAVEADLAELVSAAVKNFGGLDCAANVAGYPNRRKLLHEITREEWQRSVDINLAGVFFGMKHQIIQMMAQGRGGAIVNVCSTVAIKGFSSVSEYAAPKSGLLGLARAAVQEYGKHKIRINTVLPGTTETPMIRSTIAISPEIESMMLEGSMMDRFAHPDELGYAIRWLLSDEASFVTGAYLTVDGGDTTN